MKESLPHSAAYLIIQLSDDEQYLYYGVMTINKERKIAYHVSKRSLAGQERDTLFKMITTLAQNKTTMQKAPITIEEDLINLEKDSNDEICKLVDQLEAFFESLSKDLNPIINPVIEVPDEEGEVGKDAPAKKAEPKKEDKKAAAKGAPAKGGGKGGGAEA